MPSVGSFQKIFNMEHSGQPSINTLKELRLSTGRHCPHKKFTAPRNRRSYYDVVKRYVMRVFGLALSMLGLLWLLQGAGIIHVRPLLCVSQCTPMAGTSLDWTLAGSLILIAGLVLVRCGLAHR